MLTTIMEQDTVGLPYSSSVGYICDRCDTFFAEESPDTISGWGKDAKFYCKPCGKKAMKENGVSL